MLPDAWRDDARIAYRYRSGLLVEHGWHRGRFRLVIVTDDAPASTVEIRVTSAPDGASRVRIRETWTGHRDTLYPRLRLWQGCLNRLGRLVEKAQHRRDRIRQAVVVVHGIGEQRPGQALRRFVAGVFPDGPSLARYTKPDYVSSLMDLRSVSVPGDWSRSRPTTDVFELYWAHLIRDTTLPQVYSWLLRLLFAPSRSVPRAMRAHVWALRALLVVVLAVLVVVVATGAWQAWSALFAAGVFALVPGVLWALWRALRTRYVLGFLGDAARYLEPRPDNVSRRQEIREAGADLIDALHAGGRYDRIVVFGHSLGSVIAYDILTSSFARANRRRAVEGYGALTARALLDLEDLLNPRPGHEDTPDIDTIQRMQHAAGQEHRQNGFSWLVTDFVTAGSPLTHARWLLNLDRATSFDALVAERTFPTAPPHSELLPSGVPGASRHAFTYTHSYPAISRIHGARSVAHPNHAALFALTRWTNLYFPWNGTLAGDPVGGPLRDTFGSWIHDVPLERPGRRFAHNLYLTPPDSAHVAQVREALKLAVEYGLSDLTPELVESASLGAEDQPRA